MGQFLNSYVWIQSLHFNYFINLLIFHLFILGQDDTL